MIKSFSTDKLTEWKKNLSDDQNAPVLTTTAWIRLNELKSFISQIEGDGADSICIHLLRFSWKKDEPQGNKAAAGNKLIGCEWAPAGNDKTQVAIAISGTKNFQVDKDSYLITTEELDGDNVLLLMPGDEGGGPTGHNPPSK